MFKLWVKSWIDDAREWYYEFLKAYNSEIESIKEILSHLMFVGLIMWIVIWGLTVLSFDIFKRKLEYIPETSLEHFSYTYIHPLGFITIVIPCIIGIIYLTFKFVRTAYLDYNYFVANGGKRKRKDKIKNGTNLEINDNSQLDIDSQPENDFKVKKKE